MALAHSSDAGVTTPQGASSTDVPTGSTEYRRPGSRDTNPTNTIISIENGCAEEGRDPVPSAPYSVLPPGEKAFVIVAGSFAALISPLSSSIYLPALDSLARDMNVSVSLINLTITTYLVHPKRSSLMILMLTRLDISRTGPFLHWQFFRCTWPATGIYYRLCDLSGSQHRSGSSKRLCSADGASVSTIIR